MKKQFFLCLISIFMITVTGCQSENGFSLLDGRKQSLSDYRGQWLVINYWAEWCPPCLKEIPELNKLAQTQENISVLGVSFDKLSNDELKALVDRLDIRYPVLATEPNPYLPMKTPQSLPATFIVTPVGEIMGPLLGEVDQAKLLKLIDKINAIQDE